VGLNVEHGRRLPPADSETFLRRDSIIMLLKQAGDALDKPAIIAAQSQPRPRLAVVSDNIAHFDDPWKANRSETSGVPPSNPPTGPDQILATAGLPGSCVQFILETGPI
jgi:hypothetical protein